MSTKSTRKYQPYAYKLSINVDGKVKQYIGYRISQHAQPYELRDGYVPRTNTLLRLLREGAVITGRTVIKRFDNDDQGRKATREYANGLKRFMGVAKCPNYINKV
jgi:hypothetical protein